MIAVHVKMLFAGPRFDEAAPLNAIATTAWARSRVIFCKGTINIKKMMRKTASRKTMTGTVGPPADSARNSRIEGMFEMEVVAEVGMKVMAAKRKWTMDMMVGGSWSRRMSMATTSHSGQVMMTVFARARVPFC